LLDALCLVWLHLASTYDLTRLWMKLTSIETGCLKPIN